MKMKACLCLTLLGIACSTFADATLAVGASCDSSLNEAISAGVEPFLKGTCSITAPLSDAASILSDAAVRLGYGWPGQGLTWFGFAAADLSYRSGALFGKLGAAATVEGDASGSLPSIEVSSDVEMTLDLSRFTLSFAPALRWRGGQTRSLAADGALSSIISAGDAAVLRAKVEGGIERPEGETLEWFAGAGFGASWYPGAAMVVSVDAGIERRVSTNSADEIIDGSSVAIPNADGFMEVSFLPELSFSLGRGVRLGILAPLVLRLMDHGAVEAGAIVADAEWLLSAAPEISLRFDASRALAVRTVLGGDLAFSNSSYREKMVAYLTVEAVLSLE